MPAIPHPMPNKPTSRVLGVALVLLAIGAIPSAAPGQDGLISPRRQASRAELEQAASGAEQVARGADTKTRERLEQQAFAIRQRLQNGDFLPGDRLLLTVLGDSALSDTFTVKTDQRLALPDLPEISLRGVLDSELGVHLKKELSRYIKDPQVTAISLVRLSMMGAVARPGYLVVPADQMLSDVLMAAGGPAQNANMGRITVKRGSKSLLTPGQFSEAMRTGRSVGDISLRDGDEVVIPVQQPGGGLANAWPVIAGVVIPLFWILRGSFQPRQPVP